MLPSRWLIAASIITAAYNQSKGGIGGGGGRYEHLYGLRPQSKAVVALAWFAMAWCIAPTIICFVFVSRGRGTRAEGRLIVVVGQHSPCLKYQQLSSA